MLVVDAHNERVRWERDSRVTAAWLGAALSRQKRLTSLKKLLTPKKRRLDPAFKAEMDRRVREEWHG